MELLNDFLEPDALMPNIGSALHWNDGRCDPCAWYWKPGGCRNGQSCTRCHLCPPGALKERRKAKLSAALAARRRGEAEAAPRPSSEGGLLSELSTSEGSESGAESENTNVSTLLDCGASLTAELPTADDTGKCGESFDLLAVPPSEGSALHEAGKCEPCSWFWKPQGCRWGQNCVRCHLCPEGETKARRKKKMAVSKAVRRDFDRQ